MPTTDDLARRLQSALMRGQFTDWRKMYTGRRTADSTTLVGADTGKVWVRAEEDSREETQVWGSASRVNLPVWVGPNIAGELEIKTLEQTEAALTAGGAAAASLLPPILPDGNANVLITGRQFKPGRMRVSDLGGLYVYVEPFHSDGVYWPGGDIELTPPSTSNMQAWVAVALNPADGTLYEFQGTEYATPVVMSEADLPSIAITAGYIPVGAVVLQNGQTAITGEEVWADFHYHYAQVGSDIFGVVILEPASDTRNTVQPSGDHPALILKNNAGQTDNPFQAQTSAGAVNVAITPLGGLTVNEQGADADTRIEGDTDANLLFVDASTDRVGIGTATPATKLDVNGTITGTGLDINGDGAIRKLLTDASTELTIASGAITVTQTFHRIDTEADAASDDLDTINGGTAGQFLVIRAENAAREVVVTNSGNIATSDGNNVSLDEVYKFLLLIYDGNRSKWNVVGGGGGAAGSYYQTVKDAGSAMTQRAALNLIGGTDITLTIADDSGNNETDVTIAYSGSGSGATDGWIAAGETWTYASADDPTFTFTISGDKTTKYSAGMRIRVSQSTGGTKYFIITVVSYSAPNTTVTIYGGTDYNLENETISSPYFSIVKAPLSFPLSPVKWTVEASDTTQRVQATPTANTWYNLGSVSISIPIGVWNVSYMVCLNQADASSSGWTASATLSTANNSESDADLTTFTYIANAIQLLTTLHREKVLTLVAKTSYYLNSRTTSTGLDNLYNRNELSKLFIRATCSYL